MTKPVPDESILRRFGVRGTVQRLDGLDETTVRVGDVILKRSDDREEAVFVAELINRLPQVGFRLPRPLPTQDGDWLADRWSAWTAVVGRHEPGRWTEIVEVGGLFHRALSDEPRPSFLDSRTHQWAIGDRIAFGELAPEIPAPFGEMVRALLDRLKPLRDSREQLIHGDLTGNVLFAEGLSPAIIDFSFGFRPVGFATAVVVIDAMAYESGSAELAELVPRRDRYQLLARAMIFRLVAAALYRRDQSVDVLNSVAAAHRELFNWMMDHV